MEELGLQGVWSGLRQETHPLSFRRAQVSFSTRQLRLVLSAIDGESVGTFEMVDTVSAPPVRQYRLQASIVTIARLDTDHVVFVSLSVPRADGAFAARPTSFALFAPVPDGPGAAASIAIQIANTRTPTLQLHPGI